MANRLNLPGLVGLNTEGLPFGVLVLMQSYHDALITLDDQVLYKDTVNVTLPTQRIRAKTAQGQAFSISGINVASGEDFGALVRDFQLLLEEHLALRQTVDALIKELKGTQNV